MDNMEEIYNAVEKLFKTHDHFLREDHEEIDRFMPITLALSMSVRGLAQMSQEEIIRVVVPYLRTAYGMGYRKCEQDMRSES